MNWLPWVKSFEKTRKSPAELGEIARKSEIENWRKRLDAVEDDMEEAANNGAFHLYLVGLPFQDVLRLEKHFGERGFRVSTNTYGGKNNIYISWDQEAL